MTFEIPILFICFNRPDHAIEVLKRVLENHPIDLYVFQDHWRCDSYDERDKCIMVKTMIERLVKECGETTLHYFSPEHNMGCGLGPKTALDWFFSENEYGIIIEDDAIPHPDFFKYCEELLLKYKDDNDVWAIGSMHLDNKTFGDGSYYFSMMNRTLCAWATWKRSWKHFNYYHRNITCAQLNNALKRYGCGLRMREYWLERLGEIQVDAYNNSSWDQQFWITIWLHHGKGIMPNVNLCTNIGFDELATHTTNSNSSGANIPTHSILPLRHPSSMSIVHESDERFQMIYFEPWNYGWIGFKRLPFRLNKRIKRLLGYQGSWINLFSKCDSQ